MTELQVLGAGLGRTGTMSMKLALEELGFNPCHHMYETFIHQERNHKPLFNSILHEEDPEEALKTIFAGYKATMDYPGCLFYEEFMKLNPSAKVILTIRDSPEAWAKSVGNTIFGINSADNWLSWKLKETVFFMAIPDYMRVIYKIMASKKRHGVSPIDRNTDLALLYSDWVNRVRETVPAEKLLVFNVKEGWKPLCAFLGVSVPDKPFPRTNSTEEWQDKIAVITYNTMKTFLPKIAIVTVILCCGAYLFNFLQF